MNVPQLRFKEFSREWEVKKLGAETTWNSGGTPSKQTDSYWDGDIPWISASSMRGFKYFDSDLKITEAGLSNGSKLASKGALLLLVRGSMLFNKIPVGIATKQVAFNQDVKSITTKESIKPEFLLYWFLASENELLNMVSGTGIGAGKLDTQDLLAMELCIPTISEQTKIANFLTAIDEKITQLTQKYDLLKQYKKGVMQQIFSQKLRFKDEDGREFPEWEVKKLGELAKFRRGSFPQPYGLAKWYDEINGMPFVQVFDVDDNFRLKETTKNKISKEAQLQSVYVENGSILITIQGSIGRIAVTQYDAYVDRTLLLFESFKIKINKYYFAYVLFLLFEIEKEKAPGGIIKTITKEVLTDFKVFICDYAEQTKIANFLTAIDDKITQTQTQLEAAKLYKKGLLQQMFV